MRKKSPENESVELASNTQEEVVVVEEPQSASISVPLTPTPKQTKPETVYPRYSALTCPGCGDKRHTGLDGKPVCTQNKKPSNCWIKSLK